MSATSRTVFSVTTLLYMFITSATVVNKSLEVLHSEMNGLRGVLDTVQNSLKNSPSTKAKDVRPQVDGVWKVIGNAVRDPQRTAAALEKPMHALGPAAKAKGGLKKAPLPRTPQFCRRTPYYSIPNSSTSKTSNSRPPLHPHPDPHRYESTTAAGALARASSRQPYLQVSAVYRPWGSIWGLTTLTHGSKLVSKLRPIRSHAGRKVLAAKTSFLNGLD